MNEFEFGSILKALSIEDKEKLRSLLNKPGNLFLVEWMGPEVPLRGRIGRQLIYYIENDVVKNNTGAHLADCFRLVKNGGESGYVGEGKGFSQVLIIVTTEDVVSNPNGRPCKNLTPARGPIIDYLNKSIANPSSPPPTATPDITFETRRRGKPATLKISTPTLLIQFPNPTRPLNHTRAIRKNCVAA